MTLRQPKGIVWFVAWLPVVALTKTGPHHDHPRAWALIALFGPFAVVLAAVALRAAWLWLARGGWFIRREWEAVTTDLRERGK